MNRGRRYEDIFADAEDNQFFVDLLKETSEMWNIRIAAYCLMPNHYHLLVQTPDANISRAMRHLNGVYTQVYNRRHEWDGPLFRGRYKSILVSADSYLLQLVRYIHRNPLKADLVKNLKDYQWSSHKGYLSWVMGSPIKGRVKKKKLLSLQKKSYFFARFFFNPTRFCFYSRLHPLFLFLVTINSVLIRTGHPYESRLLCIDKKQLLDTLPLVLIKTSENLRFRTVFN
jgi:REP element-mobilizing transposase RayT